MNPITDEKITRFLEPSQIAKVEKKAAAAGISDVWQRGLANTDQTGTEEEVCKRAAIRAQQLCGCIPRYLDEPYVAKPGGKPKSAKIRTTVETRPDKGEDGEQEPGSDLPPVVTKQTPPAKDE